MTAAPETFDTPPWRSFWAVAGAIVLARIAVLIFSQAGLGPDEAQYWFWSQEPAFGYFSKPPLIAWAISLTTGFFGNADWAVRLSAPLFHAGAAAFLYLTAKRVYGPRAAWWAGAAWLTLPFVTVSSFIIATDTPLLFFWSAALYFLTRIWSGDKSLTSYTGLGLAIGLGLLSKYAMIYFVIAFVTLALFPWFREKLTLKGVAITALIAIALLAPNIFWNAQHDFQTISHTAANAKWSASLFKPLNLLSFVGGQFLVFGIIPVAALFYYVLRAGQKRTADQITILLLIAAAVPLLIVAGQAFISRAHANWAAAAYPAVVVLVTGLLLQDGREILVKASLTINVAFFACFCFAILNLNVIDAVGFSGAVKDLRGWRTQTDMIMAKASGFDAVLVDDRYLIGEMFYHQKNAPVEIAALDPNASVDNHFEAFRPFDPARMTRALFVTTRDDDAHVKYRFREIEPLGAVVVDIGGGATRGYRLYAISGYVPEGPERNAFVREVRARDAQRED